MVVYAVQMTKLKDPNKGCVGVHSVWKNLDNAAKQASIRNKYHGSEYLYEVKESSGKLFEVFGEITIKLKNSVGWMEIL